VSGYLLDSSATVQCMHGGQAQAAVTLQRVKLGGNQYTISGCGLPPQAGGPCVSAQWVVAASRVTSGGVPLVLKDSTAVCVPTGTGLQVVVVQARVKGT
jgi:hypothetical protein